MLKHSKIDNNPIFSKLFYDAASFLSVISKYLQFLSSNFCYSDFFFCAWCNIKFFSYIGKVSVHLLFLVVRNPSVSLFSCALCQQNNNPSFFLPSSPSSPLYASYRAWNRLLKNNQVHHIDGK